MVYNNEKIFLIIAWLNPFCPGECRVIAKQPTGSKLNRPEMSMSEYNII